MAKLKIAIIHPFEKARWVFPIQHDGLKAALNLIGQKHQVDWYLESYVPDDSYDWIIPWGVGSLTFNYSIEKYKGRKALLCAGHPDDLENIDKFETVFVESPEVYEQMKEHCKQIILAFGTDTDFFKPTENKKMFDAFFPATYSPWKRQRLFGLAIGSRGLTCGYMQPDGVEDYKTCVENNTYTLVGILPTVLIAQLYNMSRTCVVPAWHGSERTVLEAMSTNIPLVVVKDNILACSLVTDVCIKVDPNPQALREGFYRALEKKVNTREYVIENYSHIIYAEKLLRVLLG